MMIRAKAEIDAARRVLGNNDQYAFLHGNGAPAVQDWSWNCGCILRCSGNGNSGTELAFSWTRCGGHPQCGEVERGMLS
jgi:hypothetical protein